MKRTFHLKRIWTLFALVFCLIICLPWQITAEEQEPQTIANLVIFVKYNGDTRDIYNAEYDYTSYKISNWDQIKRMYGPNIQYDYVNKKEYDNSFQNYIAVISEQKLKVVNIFPQENADGTAVNTYELQRSSYSMDGEIISEVLAALGNGTINNADHSFDISQYKLDNLQSGFVDNLTIIVQGETGGRENIIYPHKAQYSGLETVNGCCVFDYNMLPSGSLVTDDAGIGVKQAQGVIAHEFLHTLGLPDLYRGSGVGVPVGEWDVMASNSSFLQYPLSYLRAKQGWINAQEVTTSGTYTLTAVSETGGNKLLILKTPISDSEVIVLEYRKQSDSMYGFERRIPSSGLLMYRVDTKVDGSTNFNGGNFIYVYRPDVTDAEAGTDTLQSGSYAGANAVYEAALDVSKGETEYGSTDLSKSFIDNTLYYSDGRNSGVYISGLSLSDDENQLTFTITFADYGNASLWEKVGSSFADNAYGDAVLHADKTSGLIYLAYTQGSGMSANVMVCRWNGSVWEPLGSGISGAAFPQVTICENQIYLSCQRLDNGYPVFYRFNNGEWNLLNELQTAYPQSMQFLTDESNVYSVFQENMGDGYHKLVLYDVKNNTILNEEKKLQDFGNPSVCKNGTQIYVLYSDFFGGSGSSNSVIEAYDTSKKTWSTLRTYSTTSSNCHFIQVVNGKIYAFVGKTGENPVVSVYDGVQWVDSQVTDMRNYINVSMEIMDGEVYLTYMDTAKEQSYVLRKTGNSFFVCSDDVGTGLSALASCGMGNTIYTVTKPMGAVSSYVKKKDMVIPNYGLTLEAPQGYENGQVYIDGIQTEAVKNGLSYSVSLSDGNARTAVIYKYDDSNIPRGMYVWILNFENGSYTAEPLEELEDLLSYHGFSIRIKSPVGIRFKSGIDAQLRAQLLGDGVDGFHLEEYGTLYMTNANRSKYPFVRLGGKIGSGRSYWIENSVVNDKILETVDGRYRFASVLINLPEAQYATDFAFRAYIILERNGERYVLYGPPVYRSIYTVAKQLDARGEFKAGSSGDLFMKRIINSVEKGE